MQSCATSESGVDFAPSSLPHNYARDITTVLWAYMTLAWCHVPWHGTARRTVANTLHSLCTRLLVSTSRHTLYRHYTAHTGRPLPMKSRTCRGYLWAYIYRTRNAIRLRSDISAFPPCRDMCGDWSVASIIRADVENSRPRTSAPLVSAYFGPWSMTFSN